MLKHLYIRNFVLIDELEINFDSGLSVITGETGAGKSILLGALSLLKGKRADLVGIKDQSVKSIIEARIDVSKYRLRKQFEKEDLDYQEEAIFRRELSPQGKSRAFINDTPVRLEQMQKLGELLFDIHSQHQSMQLNDRSFRLLIIDEVANTRRELEEYKQKFTKLKQIQSQLDELKEKARQAIQEEDYLQFQFEELNTLNVQNGEEEGLENEHQLLSNGEQIIQLAEQLNAILDQEDNAVLSQLHTAEQSLDELARLNPAMKELADRLRSAYLELRDINSDIEGFKDDFDFDSSRLQFLEERMGEIHRLKNKHGFESADELINYKEQLESKLLSIGNFSSDIDGLEKELTAISIELKKIALELSVKRKSCFQKLEESISNTLTKLGMPNAQFKVQHTEVELGKEGIDQIDFIFSANAGVALQEVHKIASGGELSRIMLAIKKELATNKQMPALLFDEIDTGVSGEVADQLGNILKEMGEKHQLISITHLPQLAAKGRHHYYVFKQKDENGYTHTLVKRLTENERVEELAKMLSGEKVSEAAMNNAKDLLAQ